MHVLKRTRWATRALIEPFVWPSSCYQIRRGFLKVSIVKPNVWAKGIKEKAEPKWTPFHYSSQFPYASTQEERIRL